MKEKNISSKIIIIIFTIIIVILGGYICYKERNATKEITNNNEIKEESKDKQNDNDKISQYETIKGTYQYIGEPYTRDGEEEEYIPRATITLNENGTYIYEEEWPDVPSGYMGNYIIEGKTIKLNHLFGLGSGAAIWVATGSSIITINDDNTLTIKDINNDDIEVRDLYKNMRLTKIDLEKQSSDLIYNDFNHMLNTYDITNNSNNNSN